MSMDCPKLRALKMEREKEQIFLTDEFIDTARESGLYEKTNGGFIVDGVEYHIIRTDVQREGYWVRKLKGGMEDGQQQTGTQNS